MLLYQFLEFLAMGWCWFWNGRILIFEAENLRAQTLPQYFKNMTTLIDAACLFPMDKVFGVAILVGKYTVLLTYILWMVLMDLKVP